jgi:thiol-disulfide isomerase/thioredoxin
MIAGRKRGLFVISCSLCIVLAIGIPFSKAADTEDILTGRILEIGTQAPVFSTKGLKGEDFELSRHLGKGPVIIFFWSFFCGPCREEMPVLQKIYEEMGKDRVTFVGVNLDGSKLGNAIGKFMQDAGLDFTVVFDELDGLEYKIADPYGVAGTPTVYAIDLEGNVSFSAVGRVEPEELKEVIMKSLPGS